MKKCNYCKNLLSHIEFGLDKSNSDGLSVICKKCRKVKSKLPRLSLNAFIEMISIDKETWKKIRIVKNDYLISCFGRVVSLSHYRYDAKLNSYTPGKLIKLSDNGRGYKIINFTVNGKTKSYYVHRAVAKLFVENPFNYNVVNHMDCDKSNNSFLNLEWCTSKQNLHHAIKNNRIKNKNWVPYIDTKDFKIYKSLMYLADKLNMKPDLLCKRVKYYNGNYNGIMKLKDFVKSNPDKIKEIPQQYLKYISKAS